MEQRETKEQILEALPYFSGTTNWYQHFLGLLYTDGVKYLAGAAGAYWLIDVIASTQHLARVKTLEVQIWTLTVDLARQTGIAICGDGRGHIAYTQRFSYTDYPLEGIKLIVTNGVICLPSED